MQRRWSELVQSLCDVLKESGSMINYKRLKILKEEAARVINTLGASNFVSVVVFNDHALLLDSGSG